MKHTSLRNLVFLIIEDLVYMHAWCIIYCIMCVAAFDQAQLCIINSIFKHIIY